MLQILAEILMSQILNAEVNCEADPTQVNLQAPIAGSEQVRRQTGELGGLGLPRWDFTEFQ